MQIGHLYVRKGGAIVGVLAVSCLWVFEAKLLGYIMKYASSIDWFLEHTDAMLCRFL